jgi:shikimate kinase
MKHERIFFIGPMGAGKSTVGKRLARELGWTFVDLDQLIEEDAGAAIPLIFDIEGEAGFRARETQALQSQAHRSQIVVATGGGAILAPANHHWLRFGIVVYLEAPVELQLERLARDHTRPLLRTPDREQRLRDLAAIRNPIYASLADVRISADRHGPGPTARRVMAGLLASFPDIEVIHAS